MSGSGRNPKSFVPWCLGGFSVTIHTTHLAPCAPCFQYSTNLDKLPSSRIVATGIFGMILYEKDRSLYLNLTNRCPVSCSFCVKVPWDYQFEGHDLRIKGPEPTTEELLNALKRKLEIPNPWREVVFCGFGESTYRLAEMSAVGLYLKARHPELSLRLNTVGLGNLIWGRDITPDLALFLDEVAVSLNTSNPKQWVELHRPAPAYRAAGFEASRRFAQRCVAAGIRTRVTAVALPDVDLRPLAYYAQTIGADFLARPVLVPADDSDA